MSSRGLCRTQLVPDSKREQKSGLLSLRHLWSHLVPQQVIKIISWKPQNKWESKRKAGWSQADLLQSPSKVDMTRVEKVSVKSVAARPFISQVRCFPARPFISQATWDSLAMEKNLWPVMYETEILHIEMKKTNTHATNKNNLRCSWIQKRFSLGKMLL